MKLLIIISLFGLAVGHAIPTPAETNDANHEEAIIREPRAAEEVLEDKKIDKRSYGYPLLWPSYGLGHGLGLHGYGWPLYTGWPSLGLHGLHLGYSLPLYGYGHGYHGYGHGYHGSHGGWHSKW